MKWKKTYTIKHPGITLMIPWAEARERVAEGKNSLAIALGVEARQTLADKGRF